MRYPKGAELTPDWFAVNGFDYPLMVESIEGLKLTVPPTHFTIQDVERYVGEE
jgi:JmjC domain-containing histone demethylation protein 1D/E/F/lysine-specific demethylase PHF8